MGGRPERADGKIEMPYKRSVIPVLLSLVLFACPASSPQGTGPRRVDAETAQLLIAGQKALVVDTMSHIECMDHRIPGSICIALEEFEKNAPSMLKNKIKPVIFYCESMNCIRASQAYEKAKAMGYGDIYVLKGGLPEWKRAGYDVETVKRVRRMPIVSVKLPELQRMMAERKDLLILDVRTEAAFNKGHIEGAVNIPMYVLHRRIGSIPKRKPVVVVDENGKRSFIACCYLANNGFRDVKRLFGGMESLSRVKDSKR